MCRGTPHSSSETAPCWSPPASPVVMPWLGPNGLQPPEASFLPPRLEAALWRAAADAPRSRRRRLSPAFPLSFPVRCAIAESPALLGRLLLLQGPKSPGPLLARRLREPPRLWELATLARVVSRSSTGGQGFPGVELLQKHVHSPEFWTLKSRAQETCEIHLMHKMLVLRRLAAWPWGGGYSEVAPMGSRLCLGRSNSPFALPQEGISLLI